MLFNKEGDTNLSENRVAWYKNRSEASIKVIDADAKVFLKQSMSTPVLEEIVEAKGIYIKTRSGAKLIDFHGNSLHQIGHKNPYVVEAVSKQLSELPFIPRRFTNEVAIEAACALNAKTNSRDYRVLFTPSGTGAVGIALKYARLITGKHKVISMWESFHGASLDSISVGGEQIFRKDMGPMMPGVLRTIPYKSYRNVFGEFNPQRLGNKCLDYLEYLIENEGDIGALILEPIRATDIHIPPTSYFQRLRSICDRHGIMLIFDEIPTGLGRTGTFYAHQHFGVEPDILVLGKGLGGGVIPQACVLVKEQYDLGAHISLGHYTHEKPCLGAAAIIATIKYIDEYQLLNHVENQQELITSYKNLMLRKFSCIGDIRSIGYMISFEVVKDGHEKDEELAEKIMYAALHKGLSFKLGSGNCLTWHMPLITTKEEIEMAFEILIEAVSECDDKKV